MKNYSIDILNDIYKYIKYVLSEELSQKEAAEKIFQLHNIPTNSFIGYYLRAYRKMIKGEVMNGGQIPQGIRVFFSPFAISCKKRDHSFLTQTALKYS